MNSLERIMHEGTQIAIIVRGSANVDGSKFFTDNSSQFQIGIHTKSKGEVTQAHYYIREPVTIEKPHQEIFYVVTGRIRVALYAPDNRVVAAQRELSSGDILLLDGVAHGVDFLEDTRMIEIKQGPFKPEEKVVVEN